MANWPYLELENTLTFLMNQRDAIMYPLDDREDGGTFQWCLPVSFWNANRGTDLLGVGVTTNGVNQLTGFLNLNVGICHIAAHWPLLDPAFSASYASYRSLYNLWIQTAHDMGFTVALECGIMSASVALGSGVDYTGYTLAQITAGMREHAVRLAPMLEAGDYIGFGAMEPVAFEAETGKALSVEDYTDHITDTLAALAPVLPAGVFTTAGVGSNDSVTYVTAALATDIDALDVHHYPMASTGTNYWTNLITYIDAAAVAGKPTVCMQASCFKLTPAEVSALATFQTGFHRDNWTRLVYLDRRWLRLMTLIGQKKRMDFSSWFWPFLAWSEALVYDDTTAAYTYTQASTATVTDGLIGQAANEPSDTGLVLQHLASLPRRSGVGRTART
jgi:hypothetical protein